MKRIAIYLLLAFVIVVAATELYYYVHYGGNLQVWVWNQSDTRERDVVVRVDGELVLEQLSSSSIVIPEIVSQSTSLGRHDLFVLDLKSGHQLEEQFNLFLVRWVVVSVYADEISVSYHFTPPLIQ